MKTLVCALRAMDGAPIGVLRVVTACREEAIVAMAFVVGLTGGIGSGKSAVANAFASLGVEIVDADLLAHRLSAPGQPGYAAIREAFPDVELTPDGEIDRAR